MSVLHNFKAMGKNILKKKKKTYYIFQYDE